MNGNVKLCYTVSKQAFSMVLNQQAKIDSGGIRLLDGKILEMAKPAVESTISSVTSQVLSPLTLVSSVANNVQSVMIQKGVKSANAKLDVSLNKIGQVQNQLQQLSSAVEGLGWMNLAVGVLNGAITLYGFKKTFGYMEKIESEICSIKESIEQQKKNSIIRAYDEYKNQISSQLDFLEQYGLNIAVVLEVTKLLDSIDAFLESVYQQLVHGELSEDIACPVYISLGIVYLQFIQYYVKRYFEQHGKFPTNYEKWTRLGNRFEEEIFKEKLKKYLTLYCAMSRSDIYRTFSSIQYVMNYQKGIMIHEYMVLEQSKAIGCKNIDSLINTMIMRNCCHEEDDYVCIEIM